MFEVAFLIWLAAVVLLLKLVAESKGRVDPE